MMMMSKFVSAIQTSLAPFPIWASYGRQTTIKISAISASRTILRAAQRDHATRITPRLPWIGAFAIMARAGTTLVYPRSSLTLTQSRLRWAGFNFNVEEWDADTGDLPHARPGTRRLRGCDRGEANRPVYDPEEDSRTRVVKRHPLDQRASRGFPIGQYALAGLRSSLRTDKRVSVWRVVMLNVRRLLKDSIAAARDDETNYKVARDVVAVVDEVQQIDLAMIHIHEKFEEDADQRADYQDLENRRLNRLEFLAETRSQSRRDIVAKARLLLSSQLISDYEMHCAVANSLARDVLDPE
jgi:hypothetical protein